MFSNFKEVVQTLRLLCGGHYPEVWITMKSLKSLIMKGSWLLN